jgi:hypothetical protein
MDEKANIGLNAGCHTQSVLRMLKEENPKIADKAVLAKAVEVVDHCVNQPPGGNADRLLTSDVLIYGLIQSGKTSVITAAIGVALDRGFRCIVVLTSDNDILYTQTRDRLSMALRTVAVMGRDEWPDRESLRISVAHSSVVLVCSKNVSRLRALLNALRGAQVRSLRALIIDDEADQASLNTNARNAEQESSAVNAAISDLRNLFDCASFVQATATPQALFLQQPKGAYRPRFTVLTEPGSDYVGGDFFFDVGEDSRSQRTSPLRDVELEEVIELTRKKGPGATGSVPTGLRKALNSFFVGASAKLISHPTDCFAFLCHVSAKTVDQDFLARITRQYWNDMAEALSSTAKTSTQKDLLAGLRSAYNDLQGSISSLPSIEEVLDQLSGTIQATSVKVINAGSADETKLDRPYSIFIGGNKLGRGVTIKNLLVSYYGRNPKHPNADTVLQHARMYGYRQQDAGFIRLYLPHELAVHFMNISQMESSLRRLVKEYPDSHVEGIPLELPVKPTRRNVVPRDITAYVGGGTYNPSMALFTANSTKNMFQIEELVSKYSDEDAYNDCQMSDVIRVVELSEQPSGSEAVLWKPAVLVAALKELGSHFGDAAYIRVRRGRKVKATTERRETQGILSGGESEDVPHDRVALFIYEMRDGDKIAWWPQIRLCKSNVVLYFNPPEGNQ